MSNGADRLESEISESNWKQVTYSESSDIKLCPHGNCFELSKRIHEKKVRVLMRRPLRTEMQFRKVIKSKDIEEKIRSNEK